MYTVYKGIKLKGRGEPEGIEGERNGGMRGRERQSD